VLHLVADRPAEFSTVSESTFPRFEGQCTIHPANCEHDDGVTYQITIPSTERTMNVQGCLGPLSKSRGVPGTGSGLVVLVVASSFVVRSS